MATQRNKSGLTSQITTNITTNGSGDITGAILNTLLDDFTESLVFNNGDGATTVINVDATGIGFFGATPVAQPSSTGEGSGHSSGSGTNVLTLSTFTGNTGSKAYTISDVVKHLKNLGILAAS